MPFVYEATFTVIEWLALTGLAQCMLILVYIAFRLRDWRQTSVAIAYFTALACAFGFQFSLRLEDFEHPLRFMMWFAGTTTVPLCYLLVIQVARVELPRARNFLVLLSAPLAATVTFIMSRAQGVCDGQDFLCGRFFEILYWMGAMSSALCLLALFAQRGLFSQLKAARAATERYWLVITLIVANVGRVIVSLLKSTGHIAIPDADALHIILGIFFAYLAMTTLFRVYPLPVRLNSAANPLTMTDEERKIADKVRQLLELDKLYHEPSFSRADLAREVGTSENTLSRVINRSFGKSFPRLLNEYRVEDAKRMLVDPKIAIQVLAFEVGFNSLASFNRIFKEVTGETPSQFRARAQETAG